MKNVLLALTLLVLVGCQSTTTKSTINPMLTNEAHELTSVGIRVESNMMLMGDALTHRLLRNGVKVVDMQALRVFAASEEAYLASVKQSGVKAILIITSRNAGEVINSFSLGSTTNHTGSFSPNGNNVNYTGSSNTTNLVMFNSSNSASTNYVLMSVEGVVLAYGAIDLQAQGSVYTHASAMTNGVADAVIKELKKYRFL